MNQIIIPDATEQQGYSCNIRFLNLIAKADSGGLYALPAGGGAIATLPAVIYSSSSLH